MKTKHPKSLSKSCKDLIRLKINWAKSVDEDFVSELSELMLDLFSKHEAKTKLIDIKDDKS